MTTYGTGWVNESDLCFLGGFPGPLTDALGIWAEEIDVLMPGMENSVQLNGNTYKLTDYAELIHLRTAKQLTGYDSDFYAGMPAVTVNEFGKGRAFYLAARFEEKFFTDFYAGLLGEMHIPTLPMPYGVNAATRTDGKEAFTFVMNFTPDDKSVTIEGRDFFTGEELASFTLPPHGCRIVRRAL